MIFPIGDDNIIGGHKPLVSYSLILINSLVFMYELSLGADVTVFIQSYGTIPVEISKGQDLYTLLTSAFLHAGWMHVIGNMLFLWIFADNIEAIIGSKLFLLYYLIGGIFASAIHVLSDPIAVTPAVGASGAISAVLGSYLVMFPRSRVRLFFILFFSKFELPAIVFLGIWFIQQLASGISAPATEQAQSVAWWAHIGGFVYGFISGLFIKNQFGHLYSYGEPDAKT
jgi:membrane associated rhomboid family serine protease